MGRACEASVASITCASTGRSSSGNSNLWCPPPMRLELPAARIMAAVERDWFIDYLLWNSQKSELSLSHMSQVSQSVSKYEKHTRYKRGLVNRCYNNFQCIGSTETICMPRCTLPIVHPCRENTTLCSISVPLIITVLRR